MSNLGESLQRLIEGGNATRLTFTLRDTVSNGDTPTDLQGVTQNGNTTTLSIRAKAFEIQKDAQTPASAGTLSLQYDSTNDHTQSYQDKSGTVALTDDIITLTYRQVSAPTYTVLATDHVIELLNECVVTLPSAVSIKGRQYKIINSSATTSTVNASVGELVGDKASFKLYKKESLDIISNNVKFLIT